MLLGYPEEGAKALRNEAGARLAPEVLGDLPPRLAVVAAGALGDPAAVPRLLDAMKTPELARVAGEAFTLITGAGIEDAGKPAGFESGPNDDPADENVELDPDEDLPWPDVEKVRASWEEHRLPPGERFLCGRPRTPEGLQEVLEAGTQRQRHAAAVLLARLAPGRPLAEVRARQRFHKNHR